MDHFSVRQASDSAYQLPHASEPGHQARVTAQVVALVVGFGNVDNIANCVRALVSATSEPSFDVFITESSGTLMMDALIRVLCGDGDECRLAPLAEIPIHAVRIKRQRRLRWCRPDGSVRMWTNVAAAQENLRYGGGVNAWLRPLLEIEGWRGARILNPDAEPEPTALAELVSCAANWQKGMVGSRLQPYPGSDRIHSRGPAWSRRIAQTEAVDYPAPCQQTADLADVEARLDSPSGASLFVTRTMIETIGLVDERYLLYFEDLDRGMRAKQHGGIGYAHESAAPHKSGTTTGSKEDGCGPSKLAIYLVFLNRLFVRDHSRACMPWAVTMQLLYGASFVASGLVGLMRVGVGRLAAGVRGKAGRPPDRLIRGAVWLAHDGFIAVLADHHAVQ